MADAIKAQAVTPLVVLMSSQASNAIVVPGPSTLVIFGAPVHVLSLLFGVLGVTLGHLIAPTPAAPLTMVQRVSLYLALLALVTTIVIASGQWPIVALGWGLGLGFSGITVMQTLGAKTGAGVGRIMDAITNSIASRIGPPKKDDQ